eukprot:9189058-Heterocapsa_arctica.AAC.1
MEKEAKIAQYALPHAHAWNAIIKVMADKALATNDLTATTTINDYIKAIEDQGGLQAFLPS